MSIRITKAGVLATLQDSGRSHYRHIGVGSSGAMDLFACNVANYLCGNDEDGAVIEMNFPAPEIIFEDDALISITGADFCAHINNIQTAPWKTLFVKKGDVLRFTQPILGARAYLAVEAGWSAQNWLGSYSTHLKLKIGGHNGRSLQKNDFLVSNPSQYHYSGRKVFPWLVSATEIDKVYTPQDCIRCIAAPEFGWLTSQSKRDLDHQVFTISNQSDRMGYRLQGRPLFLAETPELVSSPVDSGIVQLLPGGDCIALMADHQTTGGYPRIASVIKADLPKLAQAKPGDQFKFRLVPIEEAESNLNRMMQSLTQIKKATKLHIANIPAS